MKRLHLFFVFIFLANVSNSQTISWGTVNYTVSSSGPKAEENKGVIPQTMKLIFNDSQNRAEMPFQMYSVTVLVPKKDKMYVLMDFFGATMAFEGGPNDLKQFMKQDRTKAVFTKTDSTRKILDYTCFKYLGTYASGGKNYEITIWVAEKIKFSGTLFQGVEYPELWNLPLEWEVKMDGLTMNYVATSVNETKPDASLFVLPEGATVLPISMLQTMLPGK